MNLAPGTYRFEVRDETDEGPVFETRWNGGAYSRETARDVVVTAGNPVDLGRITVARYGRISGKLSLTEVPGYSASSLDISIFDADGEDAAYTSLKSDGSFVAHVLPGTYTARFSGRRHADDDDAAVDSLSYIHQWWKGGFSPRSATTITVADGASVTGLNVELGRTLATVVAPRIVGTATTGKTLKVSSGTWNRQASTLYGYRWKVGGLTAGTGTSYKVRATDRGKAITATVTATDKYAEFVSGTATTKAVTAKDVARLGLAARAGKRKATVTVTLTLPGTSAARTAGTVRLYDGKKLVKTVKVKRGKAVVKLKLKKGRHALKAVYGGSSKYTSAQASRTLRLR